MKEKLRLIVEFGWLYFVLPLSYLLDYSIYLKLALAGISLFFVFRFLWKQKAFNFLYNPNDLKPFFKTMVIRFAVIAFVLTLLTYFFYKELFFAVPTNNPKLWLIVLLVYSFFSVTIQEIVYRTFFFERYTLIFKNIKGLVFMNALVFSICHVLFKNELVLILTFIGGILFALTYLKTKSTLLVCIEHAVYGFWLFTVGIGSLIGFPGI